MFISYDDRYYETGYWADPRYPQRNNKVHLKNVYAARPACGHRVGKASTFQWICKGVLLAYVTCESCKKKAILDRI